MLDPVHLATTLIAAGAVYGVIRTKIDVIEAALKEKASYESIRHLEDKIDSLKAFLEDKVNDLKDSIGGKHVG